jgi:hypothetical protein
MLNVFFGRSDEAITDPSILFGYFQIDEWYKDELVKKMIKGVDDCDVISPTCIISPVLGPIAPEYLSGGVKALILMLKTDVEVDLMACGSNCAEWVIEISKVKDIKVSMSSYDLFTSDFEFDALCLNDGSKISNSRDWWRKTVEFVG